MAIRIVTDSSCDISSEAFNEMNIDMLGLKIYFGKEEFIDKVTIDVKTFYEKLSLANELPTTTLINPEQWITYFNQYPEDDIVVLPISPTLSGTYQSAIIAQGTLARENIHVVNTQAVATMLGMLVTHAAGMRNNGASALEIFEKITELADRIELIAAFDTLKYLIKGGRISGVQGAIGNVLGIKPIVHVKNGVLKNIGKARGMKSAIEYLVKFINRPNTVDFSMPLFFGSTNNEEDLKILMQQVGMPDEPIYEIGSTVGTHAGPGAIAIAYFRK